MTNCFSKCLLAGELVQTVTVSLTWLLFPLSAHQLQTHCSNTGGRIVTGSSDSGPSAIKVWSYTNAIVRLYFTGYHFAFLRWLPILQESRSPSVYLSQNYSFATLFSVVINILIVIYLGLMSSGLSGKDLLFTALGKFGKTWWNVK
jgi:hypothetical protein